uniref:Aminopeptidase NPEPL1 n=1 Tax=Tityus serrulatus TaxID=6887 RepID=A0A1S5QN31_TITSE|nr:aminopeptidase NPEPL1 [Tityus serrulatus]
MCNVQLKFSNCLTQSDPHLYPVLIIGQSKNLVKVTYDDIKLKLEPRVKEEIYRTAVETLHPSPTDTCSLYLNHATIAALPSKCSRHNTPSQAHSITKLVRNCTVGIDEFIVIICEATDAFASACAIARAFPLYSRKSSSSSSLFTVTVEFIIVTNGNDNQNLTENDIQCLSIAAEGIRLAARIVDTPCSEMHTTTFLEEVKNVGEALNITPTIIQGDDLLEQGFGGIYAVGKAAEHAPALAVLSHIPDQATETIAWVGKGIVYDTGGLCIKAKTAMTGMKRDCGGAAAILGAFYVAVKMGFKQRLHAVFCLAENAVGPKALRPDDIITLYSGRTVEVKNTDAEGRLVLGDGVAYAHKDLQANIILDMATLTGAQGTCTGKYHAAILTNAESWEKACTIAGQMSGDLLHPIPYCPELHFSEFSSSVADMKNSVADRGNAQLSCAGLFIGAHLGFDYQGVWIHIDMASSVHCGERATGYGVALLNVLFGYMSNSQLLNSLSPSFEMNGPKTESASKKIKLK